MIGVSLACIAVALLVALGQDISQDTGQQVLSVTRTLPDIGPVTPGQLVFFEDFNELNLTLWKPVITMSGCGSGEFQIYDKNRENIFVRDGNLHIQPTLTVDKYGEDFLYNGNLVMKHCTDPLYDGCNKTAGDGKIINPVISARLRTRNAFSFLYGRVEVRAKLPSGDWIWPAIWLNPTNNVYGGWPRSGEVDIMESRGNKYLYNKKWVNVGNRLVSSTLHFGPHRNQDKWTPAFAFKKSHQGFDQDFHLYQFLWTPDGMKFSIDDEVTKVVDPPQNGGMYEYGGVRGENVWANASNPRIAPFDQFFYFILNVAIGSQRGYFSESMINVPYDKPWDNKATHEEAMLQFWNARDMWYPTWNDSSALQIDYIKVWAV